MSDVSAIERIRRLGTVEPQPVLDLGAAAAFELLRLEVRRMPGAALDAVDFIAFAQDDAVAGHADHCKSDALMGCAA